MVAAAAPQWIVLHGRASSLVLEACPDEAPLWRYWGPRLPDAALPAAPLRDGRPEPTFTVQFDQPLSLAPGLGQGWFGEPALQAHRAGQGWTFQATACGVVEEPGRAKVTLTDAVAGIALTVTLALDPTSDVLTVSTILTNTGEGVLDVQWLAAAVLPLPAHARCVRSFAGRHNIEFVAVEDPLTRSQWRRENRRGLTSHDCFPGAVAFADGCAFGAQLAWSGNHLQLIDWCDDGRWQWQLGEGLMPGEVRLAPGESLQSPEVLATCAADADGVAQNFHAAVRTRMDWPGGAMRPRPVHLNTWEGLYFDHDEAALKELAEAAAQAGIERFVLDDGWFHRRNDDTSSLGDWWPDDTKYPQGLGPLAAHVTGLGMEFGLWVEPEMVNPDSELYRAHPDWALQVSGRPLITARNQLVLDMGRREVRDCLYERLAGLLSELPITYLKWDHNRDLTAAGERPSFRAQVLGTYDLLARLRAAFPAVEIEACAGGGGRIDAGLARFTHRFWTSDNIDAVSRVAIQRGFLQFLPPELMGSHVGAAPAHATGRIQKMSFRNHVALPGHFGVELDLRKLNARDLARLAEGIARYKALRDRFHAGQVWQGEAGDGLLWQAHGSAEALVLLVTRLAPQTHRHAPVLRLPMLDPARRYRVGAVIHHGAWLVQHGLELPPLPAESGLVLEVTAL
ncbi:MAG: alpha-galactosidase [Brevundimonas sp.]|nr:alpha-galactosidase [Brevundimonas sp.]